MQMFRVYGLGPREFSKRVINGRYKSLNGALPAWNPKCELLATSLTFK